MSGVWAASLVCLPNPVLGLAQHAAVGSHSCPKSPSSYYLISHSISNYCESKGWQRTQDSRCEDYKLKWCEIKCRDNYCSFREGKGLSLRGEV